MPRALAVTNPSPFQITLAGACVPASQFYLTHSVNNYATRLLVSSQQQSYCKFVWMSEDEDRLVPAYK